MPVRFAKLLRTSRSHALRGNALLGAPVIRVGSASFFAALFAVLTLLGCGEPNPLGRRPIHGQISFQGKPVDYGSIQFAPEDPQHGVSSGTMIDNGSYKMTLSQGLPPGSYSVMISAPDRGKIEKVEGPPGDERTLAVERIPAKYNLKTTLKLEVPKGRGQHTADFELQ